MLGSEGNVLHSLVYFAIVLSKHTEGVLQQTALSCSVFTLATAKKK